MNISKLKRQFIREAKASPKKLAVLALVLAIAVWRIGPLVSGMFSGNETEVTATPEIAQTPAVAVASQIQLPTAPVQTTAKTTWKEVDQRITSDPRMQSAALGGRKNPFGEIAPPVVIAEVVEEEQPDEPAPPPPAASLVLSSTVVGSQRRTALINGRTYSEGDLIDVPGDPIRIVAIRPRSVLVDSLGQQTELTIAERPASERIQVRREPIAHSGNGPEG
jgi:hypothetical protein